MNAGQLKDRLHDRLWEVVDHTPYILSATVTGSFVDSPTLEGLSDVDFVVVVDELNRDRFSELVNRFDAALRPELAAAGYDLLVNPTLGPLKFNEAKLAVLHLMLYSQDAHVDHVIHSPFTCFDWQRSAVFRKNSLAAAYPVFGLQPRHFLNARRGLNDYLADLRSRVVSFRELNCDEHGYQEVKRSKPMTDRDRHEFAYHVLRFLMRNLLKLVAHTNDVPTNADELLDAFFAIFPERRDSTTEFFRRLYFKKKNLDYTTSLPELDHELAEFVRVFESQFRRAFFDEATRHLVFRHAATAANLGETSFLGRSDPPIIDATAGMEQLTAAIEELQPVASFASPLLRCRQSLEQACGGMALDMVCDANLIEFNYGDCEGLSVSTARQRFPDLFAAWQRGEDPAFPGGGENSAAVQARGVEFAQTRWLSAAGNTVTCTHNGVLRAMVGSTLGVPKEAWHRIQIPHLAPITFIQTARFGLFVEFTPPVERLLFRDFAYPRIS